MLNLELSKERFQRNLDNLMDRGFFHYKNKKLTLTKKGLRYIQQIQKEKEELYVLFLIFFNMNIEGQKVKELFSGGGE